METIWYIHVKQCLDDGQFVSLADTEFIYRYGVDRI